MSKKIYRVKMEGLLGCEAFSEATREELKVLVAVIAGADIEELSSLVGVSPARVASSISLWRESGVISEEELVKSEFDTDEDDITEEPAKLVARDIRDKGLAMLVSEVARLLKKPALSTTSVKKIVALHTEYALSEEYILTLAAHLCDTGKLTVTRLSSEAIKLVERGIDTADALLAYTEERRRESDADARLRRLVGIYGRSISKSEHEYFNKWVNEYLFSEEIIGEAFDITVNNTKGYSASYMDAILTRWHECGCKTLAECLSRNETDRAAIEEERARERESRKKNKAEASVTPKYGAFNAEDALAMALKRSYASLADDDDED